MSDFLLLCECVCVLGEVGGAHLEGKGQMCVCVCVCVWILLTVTFVFDLIGM